MATMREELASSPTCRAWPGRTGGATNAAALVLDNATGDVLDPLQVSAHLERLKARASEIQRQLFAYAAELSSFIQSVERRRRLGK